MVSSDALLWLRRNEGGSFVLFSACSQMHREGTIMASLPGKGFERHVRAWASGILHVADVRQRNGPKVGSQGP